MIGGRQINHKSKSNKKIFLMGLYGILNNKIKIYVLLRYLDKMINQLDETLVQDGNVAISKLINA